MVEELKILNTIAKSKAIWFLMWYSWIFRVCKQEEVFSYQVCVLWRVRDIWDKSVDEMLLNFFLVAISQAV